MKTSISIWIIRFPCSDGTFEYYTDKLAYGVITFKRRKATGFFSEKEARRFLNRQYKVSNSGMATILHLAEIVETKRKPVCPCCGSPI